MTTSEKNKLLKWNTLLWLFAMVLPAALSFALASTKFPWQIVAAFLLMGCLLASNKMLIQAIEQSADTNSRDV